ncbi:hypothetical protein PInf_020141 [Phytophthora infestans]|nr:hypothetical protein PInf_020141 [Phytophthora infestans]
MAPMTMSDDACRVCGKEDDEDFLVLCDGCDRAFHTACVQGCTCCNTKPRNNFARKPAVPEGDWFCKFCAGRIPAVEDGKAPVSSVFVWGDNEDGQLALPDSDAKVIWKPTKVHELDGIGILDIACGETCTYALCNDANLYSAGTG